MSPKLLFAYGSLVSASSAAATLGHEVRPARLARLGGWRRRWSLFRDNEKSEKTFARLDDGSLPRFCLGLNLEPAPGEPGPNGVLYEVSDADLERLDARELRYDRVDAGGIVTYVAKRENFAPEPPRGSVIIAAYLETIEAAFAGLGAGQLAAFRASTDTPPAEVIEATLVGDRIPPGNPRSW